MKLPIPFLKRKKEHHGYYLALLLEDEKISAVILVEDEGKAKIVGKHHEHLPGSLESLDLSQLITITDKAISKAEEVLPPSIETHKTVFGIKESWVDVETKKIQKDHLSKLKKVCDSLDLEPLGFMVVSEAIANLLQLEEGAPLSAILIELGKKHIYASLFRGGKIAESFNGPIVHSAPHTVDTLLKQFTAPVLPAKIIISSAIDSHEASQSFMHHDWSKSLPFLHVPQIQVLPHGFDAKAVAVGAANQMGFEVAGIEPSLHSETKEESAVLDEAPQDLPAEETEVIDEMPPVGDNFGFVTDEDITKHPTKKHTLEKSEQEHHLKKYASEMEAKHNVNASEKIDEKVESLDDLASDEEPKSSTPKYNFSKYLSLIPKISLPKSFNIPPTLKNKKAVIPLAILGCVLVLGIGITAYYHYNVEAEVVLSVRPNEVSQEEKITFSTSAGSDFSEKVLAAKSISVEVDGDATTGATGKKDTGNKAKGTVTVYNSSDEKISLGSGTAIKSNNDITFTLDKDVELASASGDIFTGTKPGTAQVGVTAKDIGTESNLPSATKFSVGGNSSLAAKNDNAFSGGTKKTVTVVSKNDIEKLRTSLRESLEQKALDELGNKKTDGETVLPTVISSSISNEKFDKKVDDEAKEVKLSATVTFEGLSYTNSDIEDFEKSILKDKYSQDISFAESGLNYELQDIKVDKNGNANAKIKITAGLLPKIENAEVVNKLQGKSSKEAKEILSGLPQVTKTEIKYSPRIFFLAGAFPRLPKNIIVVVKSE